MANINSLKASDGTGNAAVATIQNVRAPLATTLIVDTVENINSEFHGTMGTPHTFVDPVTSEIITVISEATAVDFKGHVDGGNLEIDTIASGYTDNGSQVNDIVIIKPTSQWANEVADILEVSLSNNGELKAIVDNPGWTEGLPAVTAIVANGNRSYTLTHASSIASTVSAGMRRRFTRTVAANTYMGGAFNGSSHYFTKTSPSGTLGTITNNFTLMGYSRPGAYAQGMLCGRLDATAANGLFLRQEATGQITVAVYNGGSGNSRLVTTYQSVSLTKSQHIAASWTSGTVVIYFDGIAVPTVTSTSGTAPTTAGTGGDWSIGRGGALASQYFNGYLSNFAVFDAVLSAATIRQHATYKLTGSETNCIGAWSLDNTANDQSSAANNLTATGGVGFSNVSPFGNNGVSSTLEYALTMSVSSDGLTEFVQVPEGCALPTTGGITASAYSSMANPFGWVSDKGRWAVGTNYTVSETVSLGGLNQWYNALGLKLTVPIGSWGLSYFATVQLHSTGVGGRVGFGAIGGTTTIPFVNASYNKPTIAIVPYHTASNDAIGTLSGSTGISISAAEVFSFGVSITAASGTETYILNYGQSRAIMTALPSGL